MIWKLFLAITACNAVQLYSDITMGHQLWSYIGAAATTYSAWLTYDYFRKARQR